MSRQWQNSGGPGDGTRRRVAVARPDAHDRRTMSLAVIDMPAALRHLRRVQGPMRGLIARDGAPPLSRTRNSFASLGRAIIYQQLSGLAAGTIYERFLALFPQRRFPRPALLATTPVEALRGAGLSRAKVAALHDLAAKFGDGSVQPRRFGRMDAEALREALTQIRGIGPWSVDMFLISGLLRPDVLPVGDLGVRKGMQLYFGLADLPTASEMQTLAAPWQPYRSAASWYMWRVVEKGLP
jgi:DNA-3-methyladenine glycosylase II